MFAFHRLGFRLAGLTLATGAVAITGVAQASAQDLPAFTCTDKSGGTGSAAGTVYDIRVAHHNGYDRLVIGFPTANAMPEYQLNRQTTAHFVRDASHQPAGCRRRSRRHRTPGQPGATGHFPDDCPDSGAARRDRRADDRRPPPVRQEMIGSIHPSTAPGASIRLACLWTRPLAASSSAGATAIATPSRKWWTAMASSCYERLA